jgi:tetratricopeptide (TPR) repeat protein
MDAAKPLILLALFALTLPVHAGGGGGAADSTPRTGASAESLLAFAEHLRSVGEPYASVTECKRALFLFPETVDRPRANRCMAFASSDLGDREQAILAARRAVGSANEPSERSELRLDLAAILISQGYTGTAIVELLPLCSSDEPRVASEACLMLAVAHLRQGQWEEARGALREHAALLGGDEAPVGQRRAALADSLLECAARLTPRSEGSAAVLSAIVPGLGQLCSGHPLEAAHAAALSGLTGYWTYRIAVEGSVLESAMGPLPWFLRYYLGNIHWARQRTREHNEAERRQVIGRVLGILAPDAAHQAPRRPGARVAWQAGARTDHEQGEVRT